MSTFKDIAKEHAFRDKGFLVEPIATTADIKTMLSFFEDLQSHRSDLGFYTTIWLKDAKIRRLVNDKISEFIFPRVSELLNDHIPVFGNFMVKQPGESSAIGLHQDWTFVCEPTERSINVWLPLTPITDDNGALITVPYSHHCSDIIRGRNMDSPFARQFDAIKAQYGQRIISKQGEAVIFDNALMHGSDNNMTAKDRLAISLVLKPKAAKLYHYYKLEIADQVYQKEIEPSFFVDYGLFDSLEQLAGLPIELEQPEVSLEEFAAINQYFAAELKKMDIFYNADHNALFRDNGFVTFPNFLNREEIEDLLQYYSDNPLDGGSGFHATSHSKVPDYKRNVHSKIKSVIGQKAQQLVRGYRSLTSSFTVKEIGEDSEFQFHLDWSMVDESKCISITLWCPLVDTNAINGNIQMLEGSHRLGPTVRSGKGLFLYPLNDNYKSAKFKKRVLDFKAGDMVLYDHRVFHGSPANRSDAVRVSFNHVMIPESVKSIHYSRIDESTIETFEVDDDFYNRYEIGTRPSDVPVIDTFTINKRPLDQDEVNKMVIE